jgi:hypothetical protein
MRSNRIESILFIMSPLSKSQIELIGLDLKQKGPSPYFGNPAYYYANSI